MTNLKMEVLKEINKKDEYCGTIMVSVEGENIFHKAFGLANKSDKVANQIDTRYGIASGCKGFTAIAVAKLVEDGLLKYDTLLKDCVDVEFPNFDEGITVHHLLTHTSGIEDYFDEDETDDFDAIWRDLPMYNLRGPKDFLPLLKDKGMKFKVGEKFHYNNGGYVILSMIVEHVSGKSFTEYVEENVFKPCGMTDSGYFPLDCLPERVAIGYVIDEEDESVWKTNTYSIPVVGGGDGGAYTTASDMKKFWEGLKGGKILNEENTKKVLSPQVEEDEDYYYGYGVWIETQNGEILKYSLAGSDPGVGFLSMYFVDQDVIATALTNDESSSWQAIGGIKGVLAE